MRVESSRASLMFLLLLAPLLLGLVPLEAKADTARGSTPDLEVVAVTISSGGSLDTGSGILLAPGSHVVSISLRNIGTAASTGTLVLTNGTVSGGATNVIDSVAVPAIQPGASGDAVLISWIANEGLSQRLQATISAVNDPNSANDVAELDFIVNASMRGEISSHDTPEPESGQSSVRFTSNSLSINVSARNVGVVPVLATLAISVTNVSDSNQRLTAYSSSITLNPGTLTSISQASELQAGLDVSSIDGDWSLNVDVMFNSSSGGSTETAVDALAIAFSPYNAKLTSPADRSTEPGATTQLTFVLRNTGNAADDFAITLTSSRGWADVSQHGGVTNVVDSDGMLSIVVPLTVPMDADRSFLDQIDLTLTSQAASYVLSGSVKVMAGDLYRAELEAPHMDAIGMAWLDGTGGVGGILLIDDGSNYLDSSGLEVAPVISFSGGGGSGAIATAAMDGNGAVSSITIDDAGTGYVTSPSVLFSAASSAVHHTPIIPGASVSVAFTLRNTGNVPSSFDLEAGLSTLANGWLVELVTSTTDVVPVAENRTISVTLTAPSLKNPLDPSNRLRDGESLGLWMEASPSVGGASISTTEPVIVQPTIIVDPGLQSNLIQLTEPQLLGAVGTTGVEEFIDMHIEVVHNLVSGPDDSVDVAISIGNLTFVPLTSGGASEAARWNASSSLNTTTLSLGEIEYASLGILGPSDMLPVAGTLTIPVTASPTISNAQASANVHSAAVTRFVVIEIPKLTSAKLVDPGNLLLTPGNVTNFMMNLNNTGNDVSSYLITIEDGYPEQWDIGISSSATSHQIKDVPSRMQDHPALNGNESVSFELNITIPSNSPAGVSNSLTLVVVDLDTGVWLTSTEINLTTKEKIGANITVDEIKMEIALTDAPPFARVHIENTGNVLTTYSLLLDLSQSGDVAFVLDSSDELPIAAGYTASVKIRITPSSGANSDIYHLATLYVFTDTGVNESVLINVSINASKGVKITLPPTPDVVPGQNITFTIILNNSGNLLQNFTLNSSNSADWEMSLSDVVFALEQSQEVNVSVTVVVPPLDSGGGLADGESHTFVFNAFDQSSGELVGTSSMELTVAAVFQLEYMDWDAEASFHRWGTWVYSAQIRNSGNKEVTVELEYTIMRPGGAGVEQAWDIDIGAPSLLNLPVGVWVPLSFRVSAVELEPDILLAGELSVEIRPVDEDVSGSALLFSELSMSRIFSYGEDVAFKPVGEGMGTVTEYIVWSHIPLGASAMGVYEIELCAAERLINTSTLTDPAFDKWAFSLKIGSQVHSLDLSATCGSSGSGRNITLPGALPWEEQTLALVISTPVHPYLVADDGWGLTFRLYNVDEHENHTQFEEATFGFRIENTANPSLSNLRLSSGESVVEDLDVEILLDLSNTGTATAIGVEVTLSCDDGVTIQGDATQEIMMLPPSSETTLSWAVVPDRLDWWQHSTSISCQASVEALLASGNEVEDDEAVLEGDVVSWSPPPTITVIGFALLFILTGILLRLGMQSEKFMQGAAFTGAITAGLAFHMGALFEGDFAFWFSLSWLVIGALWILRIAWRSGEEFQLVHEDYQRAKQGQSTIYSDHFSALKDARRQLTTILSVPVLGTIVLVLGLPPRFNPDAMNIAMLSIYLILVIGGVWFIIRSAEKTYGKIYSKLIDIGNRTDKLQSELGDPARLLNELARSGLDLSAVLSDESAEGGED